MPMTAPDDGAHEADLEIGDHLHADLFHMDPGIAGKLVPLQLADHEVIAKEAQIAGKARDIERFYAIDPKAIDSLSVIGPAHGGPKPWTEPLITSAEGDFVAEEMDGGIGLLNLDGILTGNYA